MSWILPLPCLDYCLTISLPVPILLLKYFLAGNLISVQHIFKYPGQNHNSEFIIVLYVTSKKIYILLVAYLLNYKFRMPSPPRIFEN